MKVLLQYQATSIPNRCFFLTTSSSQCPASCVHWATTGMVARPVPIKQVECADGHGRKGHMAAVMQAQRSMGGRATADNLLLSPLAPSWHKRWRLPTFLP
eukprot:1145462-Pelagomonas_calceolata.AAC.3